MENHISLRYFEALVVFHRAVFLKKDAFSKYSLLLEGIPHVGHFLALNNNRLANVSLLNCFLRGLSCHTEATTSTDTLSPTTTKTPLTDTDANLSLLSLSLFPLGLDYITEKFYQALQLEVVPVVLGGGPYKDVAPPDSFVDALAFPSPKLLASYLKKLAADRTGYNR